MLHVFHKPNGLTIKCRGSKSKEFSMGPGCHGLPNLKWAWTFLKSGLTTKWPIKTYFVVALRPPILYGKLAGGCADKIPQEAGALIEWVSLGEADVKDFTFSTKCWFIFFKNPCFLAKNVSLQNACNPKLWKILRSFDIYNFQHAFCRAPFLAWSSIL